MGGSGGGSSSTDYPDYIKERHQIWLYLMGEEIERRVAGGSPFYGHAAYIPDAAVATMWAAVCTYDTAVSALNVVDSFSSMLTQANGWLESAFPDPTFVSSTPAAEAEIADSVAAWTAVYTDEVDNVTIPKYKAGMRDINAVMSSAFVLGQANIEAARDRDIAAYQGDLRMKAFLQADELNVRTAIDHNNFNLRLAQTNRDAAIQIAGNMLTAQFTLLEFKKAVMHYTMEAKRMLIVSKVDEANRNMSLAEMDATWDLSTYQYGANMLAAISGGVGTTTATASKASPGQSALGGALSGAAIGTEINPGWGTAIGAVVGAAAGYLTAA